jgi:hypothetical protein
VQDVYLLQDRLKNAFPEVKIKTYHDLFYEFNREKCGEKKKEGTWKHILLTANMVADPSKQKAYLDAHTTQFEKWPEVSKGFCKADFQQLYYSKMVASSCLSLAFLLRLILKNSIHALPSTIQE